MLDSLREALSHLPDQARRWFGLPWQLVRLLLCLFATLAICWLPEHGSLDVPQHRCLFILVFCASLWITEAIPAYSVALVAMGLNVALLGRPGHLDRNGVDTGWQYDWQLFTAPWASPIIWLFFGGFVLAAAAERTGLDRHLSRRLLRIAGTKPSHILAACMLLTFVFSMFMSNTATTAMMMAALGPLLLRLDRGDPFAKALCLGVAVAANLGGMGTLIGSPPNAVAAAILSDREPIGFAAWMWACLPPATLLLIGAYAYLCWRHPPSSGTVRHATLTHEKDTAPPVPRWQLGMVMVTFATTVVLWFTGEWHKIPATAISFLPITLLTATGILQPKDIRSLPWEVLLLLAGGLSLGVAVSVTGLAGVLVALLPLDLLGLGMLTLLLAYTTLLLSNFMSNTAAANILLPLAAALAAQGGLWLLVLPVALAASAAMCLPISTPTNAIVFARGTLRFTDFLPIGLLIGGVTPPLVLGWLWLIT